MKWMLWNRSVYNEDGGEEDDEDEEDGEDED